MSVKPVSVVVLVCPQCGKKYKGDASKPDARYQCPADQSTLIRLDTEALAEQQTDTSTHADDAGAQDVHIGFDSPGTAETAAPPAFDFTSIAATQHDDGGQADIPTPPAYAFGEAHADLYGAQEPASLSQPTDSEGYIKPPSVTPPPPSIPTPTPTPSPGAPSARGGKGSNVLSGFDQRRSVVAALEKLGGTDTKTGARIPVFKYETKGKLGQGGMGEVYKVLDRDLRREVAMKMLRSQGTGASEEEMLRFIKEAQATGRLEHPNIVPVHDLGVDDEGRIYFTLKYVQGLSLKEVIRGRRDATQIDDKRRFREVFPPRQMIEILVSVCNAVAYAHSKDIIHRDLKPDNVMLGKFGEVLVMDWGLAKILTQQATAAAQESFLDLNIRASLETNMTLEGAIAGTPAYMSPEQAGGKISELDTRTDVYSLGAILFEILTGEPPYKGTSALDVVKKVLDGPHPELSNGTYGFRPLPRELKAICEKAMSHDPVNRYPSAEPLRDELQAYLGDEPVKACPDTTVQKTVKWVKRNRQRVTTSVTTVIALFAIIFLLGFGYKQFMVQTLLSEARAHATSGKKRYEAYKSKVTQLRSDDPYQLAMQASASAELANLYRGDLNHGIDAARKALDISPNNAGARQFMAESYMELWRLALAEDNEELMHAYSAEVERYAADPEVYQGELEGLGSLQLTVNPPNAEIYLFRFETLHATDAQGNQLPPHLVPVPYNVQSHSSDPAFLTEEAARAKSGTPVAQDSRSIFRLEPSSGSHLGTGGVNINDLAPGSYMLLLSALGHAETRIPFKLERLGVITRHIELPPAEDVPAGFIYIAGGKAWLGGDSANALPRRLESIEPFLLDQDEISMGDYSAFIKSIGNDAKNRMPRDFGKPLAGMAANGLAPADGSDQQKFLASPVRGISYNDALAFVDWRSKHDGIAYRLPTENEWESACRGADGRKYSWGNIPGEGLAIVTQGYGDTGSNISWRWQDYKDESPWGVHSLAGGVAEWTSSLYSEKAKPGDPVYGQHTVRGNAWSLPPTGLECAFRTSGQPDYFHPTIGFRLAADWPLKRIGNPAPPAQDETAASAANPAGKTKQSKQPPKPPEKKNRAEEIIHKLGLDK